LCATKGKPYEYIEDKHDQKGPKNEVVGVQGKKRANTQPRGRYWGKCRTVCRNVERRSTGTTNGSSEKKIRTDIGRGADDKE